MKLVRCTLDSLVVERPEPTSEQPQGMCLDKGYDDDEVRELLDEFGFTAHLRARGEEAQALKQEAGCRARRWVVERTHSWMNRLSADPGALGQKAGTLSGLSPFCVRLDRLSHGRVIRIGS